MLVVEDRPNDVDLLIWNLEKGGYAVEWDHVATEDGMRERLAAREFDVVFCDYVIPGFGARVAFDVLQEMRPELPFIVISAKIGEEGAHDLLLSGAADFIAKGHFTRLIPAVRRVLAAAGDRRERMRLELLVTRRTDHDPVADLPMRPALMRATEKALGSASEAKPLALLRLRIERMSDAVERSGAEEGNQLLRSVVVQLQSALPSEAMIARIGPDEFGVLLAGVDADHALQLGEAVISVLDRRFTVGDRAVRLSGAAGIAVAPMHGNDPVTLLQRAGAAERRAARRGHAALLFTREIDEGQGFALTVEELQAAIDHGELSAHYQPKIDLRTQEPTGVEALIRWSHRTEGWIDPLVVLRLAREGRLVPALTRWVLREAIGQCRAWRMAGFEIPVAVNMTMEDVEDPSVCDMVGEILADHELPPASLELELTEDTAMTHIELVETTLLRFQALGVRVAVDDFGTGYSSLRYLQRLPVSQVKIDRSFVRTLLVHEPDAVIVRAAAALAHALGMGVVAEGVEDAATSQRLVELGCDEAQGYLFARPMPFLELGRWLARSPLGARAREAQDAHTARFLGLAEAALGGGAAAERTKDRSALLSREQHNLHLAIDHAIARDDAATALRLANALRFWWVDLGHVPLGIDLLKRALALPSARIALAERAAGLNALGMLLGQSGDTKAARPVLTEASAIFRELRDAHGLAASLNNLAMVLEGLGDLDGAAIAYGESLAAYRESPDHAGEATALTNLAANAYLRGDLAGSRGHAERALSIHRREGDAYGVAIVLDTLGAVALQVGDLDAAHAHYREAITLYRDLGVVGDVSQPMAGLAMLAAARGDARRALVLAGAIAMLRERYAALPPINAESYAECLRGLERTAPDGTRASALAEGRVLSRDEAIALALEPTSTRTPRQGDE